MTSSPTVLPAGPGARRAALAATVALFAALALLLAAVALVKPLDHDEYMYVAAGALLRRGAGLPYRDYPYFQMPGLVFVYAALFLVTNYLLLSARLLNVLLALGSCAILFRLAWRGFAALSTGTRLLAGTAAVALLVGNGPFTYTNGLAWNHDLPVLLTLAALYYALPPAQTAGSGWSRRQIGAGALLGLPVGVRLAFAPALLPFLLVGILPLPAGEAAPGLKGRLLQPRYFLAGSVLGLAPSLALAVLAPQRFLFDNVVYHFWNAAYWQASGQAVVMSVPDKLGYLRDLLLTQPACLALLILYGLFALPALVRVLARGEGREHAALVLATTLGPCLLIGALIPSPNWYQYFYAPVPFMALGAVLGLGTLLCGAPGWRLWLARLALAVGAGVAVVSGAGVYSGYLQGGRFPDPAGWTPLQIHQIGSEIRRALDAQGTVGTQDRVLTLMPLYPLEGGLAIYPDFAAGPFAWRVAPLLPTSEHIPLQMVGASDLESAVGRDAPAAVLTGGEGTLDDALIQYAQAHRYHPARLSNGFTLWLH